MIDVDSVHAEDEPRSVWNAMARGARGTCPACGHGAMYYKYLKVADTCPACGEELFHQQADDAPPYFTMMIVGHLSSAACSRSSRPTPRPSGCTRRSGHACLKALCLFDACSPVIEFGKPREPIDRGLVIREFRTVLPRTGNGRSGSSGKSSLRA